MSRTKAIKQYCLDCSNNSKGVTLCHIVDCPLWPYRCGCNISSIQYRLRIESARRRNPEEYREVLQLLSEYAENRPNLLEFVQIHAVLEKRKGSECNSMRLEVAA